MVTVYPIVVSLGVSSLAATAVIGTSACLDLGPASGNAVLLQKLLKWMQLFILLTIKSQWQ